MQNDGNENKQNSLLLVPGRLTLADLRYLAAPDASLELAPECYRAVDKTANLVRDIVKSGTRTYGVNTGVGTLSAWFVTMPLC